MKTIKKGNYTFSFNVGNCSVPKYRRLFNKPSYDYTENNVLNHRKINSDSLMITNEIRTNKHLFVARVPMLSYVSNLFDRVLDLYNENDLSNNSILETYSLTKYSNGNLCFDRRVSEKLERAIESLSDTEAEQIALYYYEQNKSYSQSLINNSLFNTMEINNKKGLRDLFKLISYNRLDNSYGSKSFHFGLGQSLKSLSKFIGLKPNNSGDFTRLTYDIPSDFETESNFYDFGGQITDRYPLLSMFYKCKKTNEYFLGFSKRRTQSFTDRPTIKYSAKHKGYISVKYIDEHMTKCKQCFSLADTINIKHLTDDTAHLHLLSITRNNHSDICHLCYSQNRYDITSSSIRGYHSNPSLKYFHLDRNDKIEEFDFNRNKKSLLVGIELEIEGRSHMSSDDRKATAWTINHESNGFFWNCADGSVSNGFEIISHPATFDVFRKLDLENIIFKHRKDYRGYYSENCGMHVHVNRGAFNTNAHMLRFMHVINDNEQFSKAIGQRRNSGGNWCRYSKEDVLRAKTETARIYKEKSSSYLRVGSDRYKAVNLQNSRTLEVRIFKSNLTDGGFRKNLEFVESVFRFTETSGNVAFKDLRNYLFYVEKNSKDYPNLSEFLQRDEITEITNKI